jgi:diacylglycerol O-acyltransferase
MSAHDAGYLTRETSTQPLHYVLQLDVEGRLSAGEVHELVAERLHRLPLAHRRLRYPHLTGRPVWVDDATFSAARMVTPWPVPLTSRDEADEVLLELTRRRLPRDRPLWNLTVAEGPGNGTTMWLSVHHAMMDGSLLVTMLRELFPANGPEAPAPSWAPVRGPSRSWLLLLVLLRGVALRLRRARPVSAPRASPASAHRTTMTGPVSAERALAGTTISLEAIKRVRRRTGATLNDLYLAVVTEALRDYLSPVPEVVLALVPRNVRQEQEARRIGNRAWSMLVPLPVGTSDPAARLQRIQEATQAGKALDSTSGTQGWRFDIALTNVALQGPHAVAGWPVVGIRASVPLQGENRLVGVLLTHDDDLTISYTADGDTYPDVARLAELTHAAWQRLLADAREAV